MKFYTVLTYGAKLPSSGLPPNVAAAVTTPFKTFDEAVKLAGQYANQNKAYTYFVAEVTHQIAVAELPVEVVSLEGKEKK